MTFEPNQPCIPERRALAERIIAGCYRRLERPAPRFIWFDNPVACALAGQVLEALNGEPGWRKRWQAQFACLRFRQPSAGQIRVSLWQQLDGRLNAQLQYMLHVTHARSSKVAARGWDDLWMQLDAYLGQTEGERLRAELKLGFGIDRSMPLRIVRARPAHDPQVRGFWGGTLEGAVAAPPIAASERVAARLAALQSACGYWSPRAEVVLCADPTQRILVDAQQRLHCERGPALRLSEEHVAFAWHGTAVPAGWIERREQLDPELPFTWPDWRMRLALAEIIGWVRVLKRFTPTVVDRDRDPMIGTLLAYELPHFGRVQFLRVRCGTGREFLLSVADHMRTARQANAWTYGLESHQYELEART